MTQKVLKLKDYTTEKKYEPEFAEVVGLSCDAEVVTLRFMGERSAWGQAARQVRLDRKLAEELSRLLNYEFDAR